MAGVRVAIISALCLLAVVNGQGATNQLSSSQLPEPRQRALFTDVQGSFVLPVTGLTGSNRVSNAAVQQLIADKSGFPFLATLPNGGSAAFITALKPCGLIGLHIHMRATEQYVVIAGQMQGGIAEENNNRQNLTFTVNPGQSMVVPQGLVHYNANKQCRPLVFIQTFNSADPGNIGLTPAITGLRSVDAASVNATGLGGAVASPQGGFALDQECLSRCGLTSAGGSFDALGPELQLFLGLSGAPGSAPGSSAGGTPGGSPTLNSPARGPGASSSG